MILIHREITDIESGEMDPKDNLLKNAPHTADMIAEPPHHYSRNRPVFRWNRSVNINSGLEWAALTTFTEIETRFAAVPAWRLSWKNSNHRNRPDEARHSFGYS